MHLVPELDSKAEWLSGKFQLCRFSERKKGVGERRRKRKGMRGTGRETERMRTAPRLNRCVLQSVCDPQSCRKEESAPSRREEQKGGEFSVRAKWCTSSQPASFEARNDVLVKPSPLVLTYETSPNTCSGFMWNDKYHLCEVQATSLRDCFYSHLNLFNS